MTLSTSRRFVLYASLALAAFLIFQVQPMVGKLLLPIYGGSAAVWASCQVFFTSALLAGYAFSAYLLRRSSERARFFIAPFALALAAGIALAGYLATASTARLTNSSVGNAMANGHPQVAILLFLLTFLFVPTTCLAAATPLLLHAYGGSTSQSPKRLYALSNAASLAALLTYPFLVERFVQLRHQRVIWFVLFIVFAFTTWSVMRWRVLPRPSAAATDTGREPSSGRFASFGLAALGTLSLVATTTQISSDVAPAPLLWIAPLVVYLGTFILAFDSPDWYVKPVFVAAVLLLCPAGALILLLGPSIPIAVQVFVLLTILFVGCMLCHGELARRQPTSLEHLPGYYLCVAGGGAAGSLAAAVLAPLALNDLWEMSLALLLLQLLAASIAVRTFRSALPWFKVVSIFVCCFLLLSTSLWLGWRRLREDKSVLVERNFFGVLRVARGNQRLALFSGHIKHGEQLVTPGKQDVATTYYSSTSGVAAALSALRESCQNCPLRVGVIGLGVGTLASYERSEDEFVFYELNPAVISLAAGPEARFSFLSRAKGKTSVVEGDARLSLSREAAAGKQHDLNLIVVDAFTGDAIPTHLLTTEALETFLSRLDRKRGILAFHVSNRFLYLEPEIRTLAASLGLESQIIDSTLEAEGGRVTWVLVADPGTTLPVPLGDGAHNRESKLYRDPWTDEHSNLVRALSWSLR